MDAHLIAAYLRSQHAELETLREKLKTYEDLGDAGIDVQLLRMGYAAARLEIESLKAQLVERASHGQAYPTIGDLCARIKAADDAAADRDYMLDSNDCIAVLRGEWKGPLTMDKPERASHGQAPAQPDLAYSEACNLATALFKKHFAHLPDYASGQVVWGLFDSTEGVILQIDNMVSGLVQPPTTSPQADSVQEDAARLEIGKTKGGVSPRQGVTYAALPEPLEIDWPELHSQALGCGVEDRDLHNRYECAEYGWQDGADKCAERVPEQIFDADQMLAFADATCALRPSHGQAPATQQVGEPECYKWEHYCRWGHGWGWGECESEYDPRLPENKQYHTEDFNDPEQVRNFRALYRHTPPSLPTAQADSVPVAWMSPGKERLEFSRQDTVYGSHTIPLYTTPQPTQPLTDAQIAEMMRDTWGCASIAPRHALEFARVVERAHGIKGGQHGTDQTRA